MIVILGLIVMIAAIVIGAAGVLGNDGSGHALTHGFAVFGYHVTGSTGTLFLCGIEVGVIGLAGLSLLLTGVRRASRRAGAARPGLRQSRQETGGVRRDRDDLTGKRETSRPATASALGNSMPRGDTHQGPDDSGPAASLLSGRRPQAPAERKKRLNGQGAPDATSDSQGE
jgi:hypothetical protein